jgi:VanZ family protein
MYSDTVRRTGRNPWLLVLVGLNVTYAALLIVLAVSPQAPGAEAVPDRLAHGVAYGIQAILLFAMLARVRPTVEALVIGCLGALAFGVFTEGLQLFQPTRSTEFMDIVADACGAVTAGVLVALFHLVRTRIGNGA